MQPNKLNVSGECHDANLQERHGNRDAEKSFEGVWRLAINILNKYKNCLKPETHIPLRHGANGSIQTPRKKSNTPAKNLL